MCPKPVLLSMGLNLGCASPNPLFSFLGWATLSSISQFFKTAPGLKDHISHVFEKAQEGKHASLLRAKGFGPLTYWFKQS